VEYGFFYVINHGIERALLERVFANSRKFFEQTMEEKMALGKNSRHRGYTWPYSEKVDDSPESRGQDQSSLEWSCIATPITA
jgi:isopenicillin N synthase-like dioxygenase